MFNDIILDEIQLVTLGGGRYKTPLPKSGFVGYDKWRHNIKYSYKYFLINSIEYKIKNFLYDEENEEEYHAKNKFENYIENNQEIFKKYKKELSEKYFNIDKGDLLEKKFLRIN